MINIALVGYEKLNMLNTRDIITNILPEIINVNSNLKLVKTVLLDNKRDLKEIDSKIDKIIEATPDIIHYTNFRDRYQSYTSSEEEFINARLAKTAKPGHYDTIFLIMISKNMPNVPILVSSGRHHDEFKWLEKFIPKVKTLSVPSDLEIKTYYNHIKQTVQNYNNAIVQTIREKY